jgi:MFS transporter, FHS family, L-fucose permease
MLVASSEPASVDQRSGNYVAAFLLATSLFFMWAIAHNLNDILIRQFEKALQLSRAQASFIQIAFYVAYFVFAIPAGYLMRAVGLKRTMIAGLLLFAAGAAGFYPAAEIGAYGPFLLALFVIASGIICLEIAAGAFIVLAGPAESSAFRINLAQAFNGLGAVLGPIIGGMFIFSGREFLPSQLSRMSSAGLQQIRRVELHQVQLPYLAIGGVTLLIAAAIAIVKFPPQQKAALREKVSYARLLSSPMFLASVVAQFIYVGAQVATWSFTIDFVKATEPQLNEKVAAFLLSGSLVLFTLGRFVGALLMRVLRSTWILAVFAVSALACVGAAVTLGGKASIGCLMAVSFFMSIMYPTIFDLGVKGAGDQAHLGAAVMVMSIVGGAVTPPLLGVLSDHIGIRAAYGLIGLNFLLIAAFGVAASRSRRTGPFAAGAPA